mmetsp:Transcript_32477/g.85054  ORF Transcript_32477/g.85054 Transcript_32477/m.85054 type:complete len:222 (-) Transcript_32477:237-902(-)
MSRSILDGMAVLPPHLEPGCHNRLDIFFRRGAVEHPNGAEVDFPALKLLPALVKATLHGARLGPPVLNRRDFARCARAKLEELGTRFVKKHILGVCADLLFGVVNGEWHACRQHVCMPQEPGAANTAFKVHYVLWESATWIVHDEFVKLHSALVPCATRGENRIESRSVYLGKVDVEVRPASIASDVLHERVPYAWIEAGHGARLAQSDCTQQQHAAAIGV